MVSALHAFGLAVWLAVVAARVDDDDDKKSSSSITIIITNSNLGSGFSLNTDSTTTSSTRTTTSSAVSEGSVVSEEDNDSSLLRFLFTETSSYYNIPVTINHQSLDLRLDVLQNDAWVLNGNEMMDCGEIDSWWSSYSTAFEDSSASTSIPASLTTAAEYTALYCGDAGLFTTSTNATVAEPDYGGYQPAEEVAVAYIDSINATGEVLTGNFSVASSNQQLVELKDFQFIDADTSNVYVGGFGLAHNNNTDTGIMAGLVDSGVISHSSYSLYFNNFANSNVSFAMVFPGAVNSKYYTGDLYQFNVLDIEGTRFDDDSALAAYGNRRVQSMVLPSFELTDILIESSGGESQSLQSKSTVLAAVFDSRTIYNSIPLSVIVNLAIQTNAFYNDEVARWIVQCDTIRETHATLNFQMHELLIQVPIDDILINAVIYEKQLTFSNGADACFLSVLPMTGSYATLGLSAMKSVFMAVDHEGGTIGLARANKGVQVKYSDYFPDDDNTLSPYEPDNGFNFSKESVESISEISPGTIPFATTASRENSMTLSYEAGGSQAESLTIPARLSGVLISSGEVVVTQNAQESTSDSSSATAASEDSHSKNGSGSNHHSLWQLIVLVVFPAVLLAV
ncbi:peptidase A1-like protein [Yamadazyma tenuis]|uniref:Acid protease n=1 Tax=Candida tenuis (strain ATCC 10573 / BCRC 21748 / CBS 615 / JCM 9827 / NBRC 10315 / NRRL Y-1498 / VKM Y-70) TaxID=590646 RepID=G3BCT9_CANTC|nr:acid protease [Yamadazyma tenuis ATCC 10573]EGV60208.1 acid protease [Yamadazyma tenuis ATCC 10573]WEJ94553.1 peptidase A1-like protein [Yamadazyma tenuis]